ncbi:MAG: tRNA 2-thiouridine(34) synthase MnmA [Patescibacteria group bacterium]
MAINKPKNEEKQLGRKVLVGMSGGVDSSVAAALLLQQGYEVIGAFMKNWSDGGEDSECSWRSERRDAMRVAAQLGISLLTFDFEKEYREEVYEYMINEYKSGRTPNPDVLCNKYMKFGHLWREAEKLGCDFIATGHYARIERDATLPLPEGELEVVEEKGQVHLFAGVDKNKDQSYFLCQLSQEQLRHVLLPIGDITKPEVRKIARKLNLVVADKKDSQGICFVGKVKMQDFLKISIPEQVGNIVTTSGEVIGQHKGHAYYTIGQRTGLGLGGGTPYFIVERRPETNEIIVAVGEDDPALFSSKLQAVELVETIPENLQRFVRKQIKARIRYRQPLQDCTITAIEDSVAHVKFDEPQRAVAPGQFIVWYDGEELIGSGIIK